MATSNYQIALLKGDGIDPEVIDAAMAVLHRASTVHGFKLHYQDFHAGTQYYQRTGKSINMTSKEAIGKTNAILLGAMDLPDVRKPDQTSRASPSL
jgi:3-isopropylmalate dehydrogenase